MNKTLTAADVKVQEDRGIKLHRITEQIRSKQASVTREFIELGWLWKTVRDETLWDVLEYCHSFREYCEKEAGVSHTWVYQAIRVAETFGSLLDAEPELVKVDHSRLVKILPMTEEKSPEVQKEWVQKAIGCSKQGFENNIREAKGKIPTDACAHPAGEQEPWNRCRVCNGWTPIKKVA